MLEKLLIDPHLSTILLRTTFAISLLIIRTKHAETYGLFLNAPLIFLPLNVELCVLRKIQLSRKPHRSVLTGTMIS